jgi:hypothetical protein
MRRLERFFRLPWQEKMLLLESIIFVSVATLAVAVLPFSVLQRWTSRKENRAKTGTVLESQISWALGAAGRAVPASTCLAQALAAQAIMRRCGYHPVIRVGVRKGEAGNFGAHAWVESGGTIVAGGSENLEKYDEILVL